MTQEKTYHRIALFAQPELGQASMCYRMQRALLDSGHSVFLFTPEIYPQLFQNGILQTYLLQQFFEQNNLDFAWFMDSTGVRGGDKWYFDRYKILFGYVAPFKWNNKKEKIASPDFTIQYARSGKQLEESIEVFGLNVPTFTLAPVMDQVALDTPLANDIAYGAGILCVQDACREYTKRVACIQQALSDRGFPEVPFHCVGEGWQQGISPVFNNYFYAARSSVAAVVFGDEALTLKDDIKLSLPIGDGLPVFSTGGTRGEDSSYFGSIPTRCESDEVLVGVLARLLEQPESKIIDHVPTLEQELTRVLSELEASFTDLYGRRWNTHNPSKTVALAGYFGCNNFGDELIVEVLAQITKSQYPEAQILAISENPWHTLTKRGFVAVGFDDKVVLDRVCAQSSAVLVGGGLLFDQGIRWTSGKSELLNVGDHSDIPCLTGLATLCYMNNTPLLFYGIGGGPLEVDGSLKLLSLAGALGARFLPRDEQTSELIRKAGVKRSQITTVSDVVFALDTPNDKLAHMWGADHNIDFTDERVLLVSLREYEGLPHDFAMRVAAALDYLLEQDATARVLFIDFDTSDHAIHTQVQQSMQHADRGVSYGSVEDIMETLSIIAACDSGFAMRFHCSLLLNNFGKPSVGLNYLPKVEALYEAMDMQEVLLSLDATTEDMQATLSEVWDNHAELSTRIAPHVKRQKALTGQAKAMLGDVLAEAHGPTFDGAFYLHDQPELKRT